MNLFRVLSYVVSSARRTSTRHDNRECSVSPPSSRWQHDEMTVVPRTGPCVDVCNAHSTLQTTRIQLEAKPCCEKHLDGRPLFFITFSSTNSSVLSGMFDILSSGRLEPDSSALIPNKLFYAHTVDTVHLRTNA